MKRIYGIMFAMLLTCSLSVLAGLTIELDPQVGTVVKGFDTTASQKVAIYLTSQGEKYTNFNVALELPVGVTMADGVTSGQTTSVIWNSAAIWWDTTKNAPDSNEVTVNRNIKNGRLAIAVARNALKAKQDHCLILESGVRTKLCDIEFNVNINAVEETVSQLVVTTIVNKCQAEGNDTDYNANSFALSFNLLRETYGFTTNAGAKVVLDEDAAPVAIVAADKDLFSAQIWDVDKEDLVDTDAVEFTAATASDAAAGTVALDGGKIVYTPAENYSGSFTINYTAKFTDLGDDAVVDGSIDVTVNAVNDAPAIAILAKPLTVNEGEALTFTMSFSDVDTAWDAFTKTVTLGGEVVEGTWTAGSEVIDFPVTRADANVGGDVPAGEALYTFTAANPVSYDVVAHPAKTAEAALVVTIDDNAGDDGSVGTANADVTINDVDQATDFGQSVITATASTDPAVFGSKLSAEFTNAITDADGDVAEIAYQWYRDGAAVDGETARALKTAVKKGENWTIKATATVKPYGDEVAVQQEFVSNEIAIGNTAPTTADAAVFIRKTDGAEATATVDITMADVDEDELTIIIKNQGTKGTAVVEGNAIKYTVTDTTTEFFDDAADKVTFVVNDGTDDSAEATLTVTYRENPPAEIAITTEAPETIDEVDEAGEAVAFTVAISATDSNEVEPAGIKTIEWTADEGLILEAPTTEGIGTAAATSTVVVKTKGYETLDGAARTASKEFNVKVTVTDALNAVTTETFKVTVNDVDRKAPANFTIALNPAEPKTEVDLTAVIDGAAEDPDGDAITGYKYVWTVNGEEVAENGNVLAADVFQKGNTVAVKAAALTKPYDAEEVENDMMEEAVSVVIGNTAPTLALADGAKLEATEDQAATEYALAGFVVAADPDAAVGIDTLAFTVTPNFGDEVGTLAYDAEAGNVTFTPAPDYNTEGLEALPTFSVTVSDGEVTTDAVNVEIAVAAVNDAPTATVADVYIQPEQAGQEVKVAFAVTAGPEDEAAQQIFEDSCEYIAPEDGKKLLDGFVVVVRNNAKTIDFTFNVAEDAEIGAEGTIKFVIKDDAGAYSEEYSFKVVLSGTPWYPTIEVPCEHNTEGVVVRFIVDAKPIDIVVKEKTNGRFQLTPAVYYNNGFKGFEPNVIFDDIIVFHWNVKEGAREECGHIEETKVADYQAPGMAVIDGSNENPNVVTVSAPMASGFELYVYDEGADVNKDAPVTKVLQDFVPSEDGQINPLAKVTLAGLKTGKKYMVFAAGYNPMRDAEGNPKYGPGSQMYLLDLTADEEEWAVSGEEYFPPRNWTTFTTSTTNITFKWPVNAKADSYTLRILDGEGNTASVHSVKSLNSITITDIPVGNYRWYVETSDGKQSEMMIFSVVKKVGENPVITRGVGTGNTLWLGAENLTPGADYQYDVIYFDANYNQWAYQLFTGKANEDGVFIALQGADATLFAGANYIMIRPWTAQGDGEYQTLLINSTDR